MQKIKKDFCINCRKKTDILWGKAERIINIKELEEQYQKTYGNK